MRRPSASLQRFQRARGAPSDLFVMSTTAVVQSLDLSLEDADGLRGIINCHVRVGNLVFRPYSARHPGIVGEDVFVAALGPSQITNCASSLL